MQEVGFCTIRDAIYGTDRTRHGRAVRADGLSGFSRCAALINENRATRPVHLIIKLPDRTASSLIKFSSLDQLWLLRRVQWETRRANAWRINSSAASARRDPRGAALMHSQCSTSTAIPQRDGRDHARPKNGLQSGPVERAARALVGTAQERKQASACGGSQDIKD